MKLGKILLGGLAAGGVYFLWQKRASAAAAFNRLHNPMATGGTAKLADGRVVATYVGPNADVPPITAVEKGVVTDAPKEHGTIIKAGAVLKNDPAWEPIDQEPVPVGQPVNIHEDNAATGWTVVDIRNAGATVSTMVDSSFIGNRRPYNPSTDAI